MITPFQPSECLSFPLCGITDLHTVQGSKFVVNACDIPGSVSTEAAHHELTSLNCDWYRNPRRHGDIVCPRGGTPSVVNLLCYAALDCVMPG